MSVGWMSRYGKGRATCPQMACVRRSQLLFQIRFSPRAKHIVAGINQHISLNCGPPMHCQCFAPSTASSKNFQCFEFALLFRWQWPESRNTKQRTSRRAGCYGQPNPGAMACRSVAFHSASGACARGAMQCRSVALLTICKFLGLLCRWVALIAPLVHAPEVLRCTAQWRSIAPPNGNP